MVNLDLIDNAEKTFDAGTAFRQADVDLIFLYVSLTPYHQPVYLW